MMCEFTQLIRPVGVRPQAGRTAKDSAAGMAPVGGTLGRSTIAASVMFAVVRNHCRRFYSSLRTTIHGSRSPFGPASRRGADEFFVCTTANAPGAAHAVPLRPALQIGSGHGCGTDGKIVSLSGNCCRGRLFVGDFLTAKGLLDNSLFLGGSTAAEGFDELLGIRLFVGSSAASIVLDEPRVPRHRPPF